LVLLLIFFVDFMLCVGVEVLVIMYWFVIDFEFNFGRGIAQYELLEVGFIEWFSSELWEIRWVGCLVVCCCW